MQKHEKPSSPPLCLQLRSKLKRNSSYKLSKDNPFRVLNILFRPSGRGDVGSLYPITVASGSEPQVLIQMMSLQHMSEQLMDHIRMQATPLDER